MITKIEKYGANYCMPCKIMDKTLEEISGIEIAKIDITENTELAVLKKVKSIPTLIFYNEDNEVDRLVGGVPLKTINDIIEKWKN
jgi:thioredoxin 1